mmetsp:Transcript_70629/g.197300  ORF Transcript_70629/g.197300 Transcript_70629/m.197300 type:complete len:334 (-) Transcript_70629:16-1017(-)
MFDLFQRHRHHALNWLTGNPDECNQVMEDIVKTITFTSKTEQRQLEQAQANKDAAMAARGLSPATRGRKSTIATVDTGNLKDRQWHTLTKNNCIGRFIPDTEHFNDDEMNAILSGDRNSSASASASKKQLAAELDEAAKSNESFEQWLRRVTTQSIGTEINLQVGEFTMKKHRMQMLNPAYRTIPEFIDVFGYLPEGSRIQCAEVKNATKRVWLRLVGRRHDLLSWAPDERPMTLPEQHKGGPVLRPYEPHGMATNLKWVSTTFEPIRRLFFPNSQTFFTVGVAQPQGSDAQWIMLCALVPSKGAGEAAAAATKKKTTVTINDPAGAAAGARL